MRTFDVTELSALEILSRYGGRGVLKAVGYVNGEIADLPRGRSWNSLAETDRAIISLDGTPGKSRLGANAIVGVSMALARAPSPPGRRSGAGSPRTVTETLEAMAICRRAGYRQFVSHRSGEPGTRSSPTSPSAPAAGTSSPACPPAASGSPSTTGCWKSLPDPSSATA
jgi:hypothetical protein